MKLHTGKQFYKLVVVAWLTFSLGSVVLALVSWHQLAARMDYGRQIAEIRDELNGIIKSLLDFGDGRTRLRHHRRQKFPRTFQPGRNKFAGAI